MDIAIVAYDNMAALDAIGPFEVFANVPDATVTWVGTEIGMKRTEEGKGGVGINADATIEEVPSPDIIVVPGGHGEQALRSNERFISWLRAAHETSQWTTSVCTGSLILGAAGLLDGLRATSHWTGLDVLRDYGAEPTLERVVVQGRIVTAAGVSSGIDMALTLTARIAGDDFSKAVQLGIEYDPQPPFDAGAPHKAPEFSVNFLRDSSRFLLTGQR